jgi:hypothetical protein
MRKLDCQTVGRISGDVEGPLPPRSQFFPAPNGSSLSRGGGRAPDYDAS